MECELDRVKTSSNLALARKNTNGIDKCDRFLRTEQSTATAPLTEILVDRWRKKRNREIERMKVGGGRGRLHGIIYFLSILRKIRRNSSQFSDSSASTTIQAA